MVLEGLGLAKCRDTIIVRGGRHTQCTPRTCPPDPAPPPATAAPASSPQTSSAAAPSKWGRAHQLTPSPLPVPSSPGQPYDAMHLIPWLPFPASHLILSPPYLPFIPFPTLQGNHMMRGISGGERKRVSIGHELLINPSVIFLDEVWGVHSRCLIAIILHYKLSNATHPSPPPFPPLQPTSGLDSTTALNLMHTLRTLASGGRTIITSIHQPSSRLYQQMDKVRGGGLGSGVGRGRRG